MRKHSLGPDTGTLDTVAVGCTTLAMLVIIGVTHCKFPMVQIFTVGDETVSVPM